MLELHDETHTSTLAMVAGEPFTEMPADLFIPPDALKVCLNTFSGPLDLLLYLIRRQNIDILNIPISLITKQYMLYIHIMEEHRLELAAEYLVMAAMLAEIKSKLLLPISPQPEEEAEEDPRLRLIRKLQAYEQIKQGATLLDNLPRCERDTFSFKIYSEKLAKLVVYPEIDLALLVKVMQDLLKHQRHLSHHQIIREPLSVRERMASILNCLSYEKAMAFEELFCQSEGRMGLVVTFLAILELVRQSLVRVTQILPFQSIHLQAIHEKR
jgi:segregation and condensation protein A